MKFRRRHRVAIVDNDRLYLIENNHNSNDTRNHSKITRIAWKLAKHTWKACKVGFQAAITSQPFYFAIEPTALATTIAEIRTRDRQHY
ncbi:unnamed protein product [Rotaria socialis]|uniref:Uncharacterized protein n=3 Tax=Rotaria socialis TaxID=392032 RepID=A0A820NVL4_9BILA|nr:unnamed protein product [Rotaria socialis]CAF3458649.1 unnamed protein product [Rotaria socialis]CAF3462636.1 unnamed protein product [Rotaria socialis]CAF4170167.1 unnamed protein product [Rotaria socialis]CAF4277940.1 unnamed protein product [Rotaria socialis]